MSFFDFNFIFCVMNVYIFFRVMSPEPEHVQYYDICQQPIHICNPVGHHIDSFRVMITNDDFKSGQVSLKNLGLIV